MPVFFSSTFAALKHRNYQLWFAGQLVSLVGTWMQTTAQGFLVYSLTQSPAYLGYVAFASGLPIWLFTLYGGIIADRISRRLMLILTQSAMMILAFILAGLVFLESIQPWHIVILAFFLGVANAFDAPVRQAFVVELVTREDLTNAVALNSAMFNAAIVVGPAVAGLTYAWLGPGWCFIINGFSFMAVILALSFMKLKPLLVTAPKATVLTQLKEGIRFVTSHKDIRMIIANMGVVSLFGMGMVTLMPAWAVEVLHGDVTTNGALLSARGVGSLIGALIIASTGRLLIKGKLLTLGSFSMPVLMVFFAVSRLVPVSLVSILLVGFSFMLIANSSNAIVQTLVADNLRGRVMGIYTLVFFGLNTLGGLAFGVIASSLGEMTTVIIASGFLLAMSTAVWVSSPSLRRLP